MRSIETKLAKLLRKNPWMEPRQATREILQVAAEPTDIEDKRRKVIKIVDRMGKALRPHVACESGCSQCCHMNTMIYEHEAKRLAEVSGRQMTALPYRPLDVVFAEGAKYNFLPCPFLVNKKCSVYDDRPLVCRVHHSLSNSALDCNPFIATQRPPMYDPDIVEVPYRMLNRAANPMEPWGNIAEFFPTASDVK
jgi:Fe-S-cluster containining protein